MSQYTSDSIIINYRCWATEKRMTYRHSFGTDIRYHALKVILWKVLISESNGCLRDIYV